MRLIKSKEKEYIREYNKQYYQKNKTRVRALHKRYQTKNRDKCNQLCREYYQSHKETSYKHSLKWRKKNREKYLESERKGEARYRLKNPIKIKAYNLINNFKMRDKNCKLCGNINNLHFHHTNYERNVGFTLCKNCHKLLHRGMMLG